MRKKLNVIVAHQNYFMQLGITQMLRGYPHKEVNVTPVQSDKDLMLLIATNKYDLLILSTRYGDDAPLDFIYQARKNALLIPMLFISNCMEERLLREAYNYNYIGFIHTGCGQEEFSKAVHTLLVGQNYYSHEVATVLMKGKRTHIPKINQPALTRREKEVLRLSSLEFSSQEIAQRLNVSIRTVEGYRSRIKSKLKSKTWIGAIQMAHKYELIL